MTKQDYSSDKIQGGSGLGNQWTPILWLVWILFLIAGIVGVVLRMTHGHNAAGYGSYVPWGLWIGVYFLGVGISGGSFILGGLGYLFGVEGFSKPSDLRCAIVLSLAALLPAFLGVWLDLGRMDRLMNIIINPSFTSMMAFNAWMYNIFMVVAVLCWLLSFKQTTSWLKPLLTLGMFFSFVFQDYFFQVSTNFIRLQNLAIKSI